MVLNKCSLGEYKSLLSKNLRITSDPKLLNSIEYCGTRFLRFPTLVLALAVPLCVAEVEDRVISVIFLALCNQHAVSEVCLRLSGVKLSVPILVCARVQPCCFFQRLLTVTLGHKRLNQRGRS